MKNHFNLKSGRNIILAALVLTILVSIFSSCAGELNLGAFFNVKPCKNEVIVSESELTSETDWEIKKVRSTMSEVFSSGNKIAEIEHSSDVELSISSHYDVKNDSLSAEANAFIGGKTLTGVDLGEERVSFIKRVNAAPVIIRDTVVLRDTVYIEPQPGVIRAYLVADTVMNNKRKGDAVVVELTHHLVEVSERNDGNKTTDSIWSKNFPIAEVSYSPLNGKVYSKAGASSLSYSSNVNWLNTTERQDGAFTLTTRTGEAIYNAAYSNVDGKAENWNGKNSISETDVKVSYKEYNAEFKFNFANTFAGQKEENRNVSDESQFTYNGTSVANWNLVLNGVNMGTQSVEINVMNPVEEVAPTIVSTDYPHDWNTEKKESETLLKYYGTYSEYLRQIWSDSRVDTELVAEQTALVGKTSTGTHVGHIYSQTRAKDIRFDAKIVFEEETKQTEGILNLTIKKGYIEYLGTYICDAGTEQNFRGANILQEADVEALTENNNEFFENSFTVEFAGKRVENRGVADLFEGNHQFTYDGTVIGAWNVYFNGEHAGIVEMEIDVYLY